MTSAQYREALFYLGLTQQACAELLGVSLRTANGWANDKPPIPWAYGVLLRLLVAGKIERADLDPQDYRPSP